MTTTTTRPRPNLTGLGRRKAARGRTFWAYAFLLPMLLLFGIFEVLPILYTAVLSFFSWDGYGPLDDFVGLRNYENLIADAQFWRAIWQAFAFTVGALLLQVPTALLVAIALNNDRLRGRTIYRALFFIPVVSTTSVIGVIFVILLSPLNGPISAALMQVGLLDAPLNVLGSQDLALPAVVLIDLWKTFGVVMIYWLAALQTIPRDLIEASWIDGASKAQTFFHIVVPLLVPLGVIILLLTTVQSFNAFDLVQTMTAGGPGGATDILPTYVYRNAFNTIDFAPRMGLASAAALIFGVLVTTIAASQYLANRALQRKSQ